MYNPAITEKLFELAKEVIPVRNARIVAAVVKKGKILSIGNNQLKTHPRAVELQGTDKKPYLHAEMNAIFQLDGMNLKGCDIYVIRAKYKTGIRGSKTDEWEFGISVPCPACKKLIDSVGIKNIYCLSINPII